MAFASSLIYQCSYCGERYGAKAAHCKECRTQAGRKKVFDSNVAAAIENKAKGYTVPQAFPNWK